MKTALIAGSTGLTGSELLKLILKNSIYHQVIVLVRQNSPGKSEKIIQHKINFEVFEEELKSIPKVDDVFCCLGSTMKKAGSKEAFRKVDYEFPLELARWAAEKGVKQFLCISALGADESSSIFYNRVKGEMERDVSKLNIPSITFLRPSLLIGNREENRPMERLGIMFAKTFSFLFVGPLKKYKGIAIEKVAGAMYSAAQEKSIGVKFIESEQMGN